MSKCGRTTSVELVGGCHDGKIMEISTTKEGWPPEQISLSGLTNGVRVIYRQVPMRLHNRWLYKFEQQKELEGRTP